MILILSHISPYALSTLQVKMGLDVYESGVSTGISEEAWDIIHDTKVQQGQQIQLLKALHFYIIMIGYVYYGFRKTTRIS